MTHRATSDRVAYELFPGEIAYSWVDSAGDECAVIAPESRNYLQVVVWEADSEATDTRSVMIEREELPGLVAWLQEVSK